MKIHFPLTGFNLSGGVRVITMIANGLAERDYEVRITVPRYRDQSPFTLDNRVEVRTLGEKDSSRFSYSLQLAREAAQWGDVLVATNFKTPHILRKSVVRNHSEAKILYLVQGYEPYTQGTLFEGPFWRRWLNRRVALRGYEKADLRCYVSKGIAKRVDLDPDPCLVYPGFNPAIFSPSDERRRDDQVQVGFIARTGRLKGAQVFTDAISRLRDLHPKIHWVVLRVGDLPPGLPNETEILTAHNDQDMADFYRRLDIFAMPSLYEGFGLPALEAMACGAAVVASDVDGVLEFAENEVNSIVFPTGESAALAESLRRLILSRELRTKLANQGIETSRRFTWTNTVDRFEEALKRVRG
ncbi:MAG: glycosyltransferase family 4 protein [Candidatus Omnitrophica bacterium]|nr:glycosyltransferase family 4 protein [Candidatus Omnitrophota bacterium]